MKSYWALLGPHKKHAFFLFFLMLGSAAFEACGIGLIIPFIEAILSPDTTASNITSLPLLSGIKNSAGQKDFFLTICIIVIAVFILKNIVIYARSVFTTYFMIALRRHWSCQLFEHYIEAEYDTVISTDRGKLINNSVNEPIYAAKMVGQAIDYFTRALIVLSIYGVMLYYSFKITLIISVVIFLVLGTIWKLSTNFSIRKGEVRIKLNQFINTLVEQALNGIRQVKIFNLNKDFKNKIKHKYDELCKVLVKISMVQNIPLFLGEMLIIILLVLSLIYMRYYTNIALAAIFPTLAFITIAGQKLYQNLSVVVSGRVMLLSLLPSLRLINQLISDSSFVPPLSETYKTKVDAIQGDIYFKNVSFAHHNSKPIFDKLNLRIKANGITAIIGSSGAGKSTLVDLLVGLYRGYEGEIIVGDKNIDTLNVQDWRKIIGYVSQDIFLFNLSVKDNILMGNPFATEEDIIEASKKAFAHEFILALPDGYSTTLGDRGQKISRGQAQRITLARAILSDPKILIFDEATSALDNETEKIIQSFIDAMKGQKTIITIAHRLSTIKNADSIYELKDGQMLALKNYNEDSC